MPVRPAALGVLLALALALPLAGCRSGDSGSDGASLVKSRCSQCHAISRVQSAAKDRVGWESTLSRMEQHGLKVTPAERSAILDYLAATYPVK